MRGNSRIFIHDYFLNSGRLHAMRHLAIFGFDSFSFRIQNIQFCLEANLGVLVCLFSLPIRFVSLRRQILGQLTWDCNILFSVHCTVYESRESTHFHFCLFVNKYNQQFKMKDFDCCYFLRQLKCKIYFLAVCDRD